MVVDLDVSRLHCVFLSRVCLVRLSCAHFSCEFFVRVFRASFSACPARISAVAKPQLLLIVVALDVSRVRMSLAQHYRSCVRVSRVLSLMCLARISRSFFLSRVISSASFLATFRVAPAYSPCIYIIIGGVIWNLRSASVGFVG